MLIGQLGWLVQHSVCLSIVCERVVCWRDRQTGIFFLRLRCHKLTWLMDRGEGWEPVTLLSPVLVWHWFALMRFRDEQIREPVAAIVLPDMLMDKRIPSTPHAVTTGIWLSLSIGGTAD